MEPPVDDIDRALFAAATRVQVKNGRTASFWHSSWIDGQSPATLFPLLYIHSNRKNRTVADAMLNNRWVQDVAHHINEETAGRLLPALVAHRR
jgi:hypothetical protein